eukprot:TRINITY_DN17825_c0_g1_i3.p1 TRINITY_DN17825_c0_g1~~TRINITY_DN17825_c0_g1_i3.p1  ORF type:complete len:968 (+),score=233.20 TRINITY_DN17825_c0_g1_i3:90-2993(+)
MVMRPCLQLLKGVAHTPVLQSARASQRHHVKGPKKGSDPLPKRTLPNDSASHLETQANTFAHQFIIEAACVAKDLQYTFPPAHVEKVATSLAVCLSKGRWDDRCCIALDYLLRQLDPQNGDALVTLPAPILAKITPLLALLFRDDLASFAPDLSPALVDRLNTCVKQHLLAEVERGESLTAALTFTSSPTVLRSEHSLALVQALHDHLSRSFERICSLDRTELLRLLVMFAAVGLAQYEPHANQAPRWDGKLPRVHNMKRLLSQAMERLMIKPTFNALDQHEIATALQATTHTRVISAALVKALVERVEGNSNYKSFTPPLLVEVMYRTAIARCLHPVQVRGFFEKTCAWLREEVNFRQLNDRHCGVLVRSLTVAKYYDHELAAACGRTAAGGTVLNTATMYIIIQYAQNFNTLHDVVEQLCATAMNLDVLGKDRLRKPAKYASGLTHLFKNKPMPADVRRFLVGVLQQSATNALDINACVEGLLSVARGKLGGSTDVDAVLETHVSQYYKAIQRAEKTGSLDEVNEITLSKYLLALSSIPGMAHQVYYAYNFLLRRPSLVSSLHPATMWWALAPLGRYRRDLGDLNKGVVKVLMEHALQPHVVAEFDPDTVFHLHRCVRNAGLVSEHLDGFVILVDRLFGDTLLLDSMTHSAAINLLEVLAYLQRDCGTDMTARVKTLFISRLRPNMQYLLGKNRGMGMKCVRFIASLRTEDPSVVADVVKLSTDLVTNSVYPLEAFDQCVVVSSLLQLHTLKPALLNDIVSRLVTQGRPLNLLSVRWLLYGIAKTGADTSHVMSLSLCALSRVRGGGAVETSTPAADLRFNNGPTTGVQTIAAPVEEKELTLVLWSLCRLMLFPQPFFPVLCRELADAIAVHPAPLSHLSQVNVITIVNGLLDPVPAAVPECNALLAAFLNRAVECDALRSLHYSKINAMVAALVERGIRDPTFLKAARAALQEQALEEAAQRKR